MEKSKYINTISNACTKVEYYQYEYSRRRSNEFNSIDGIESGYLTERKMNRSKDFETWTNQYGGIKQVYTTASLLQMLVNSNLFFLANEGDAILQESSFFNPSDVTADVKQGTLIDCKYFHHLYFHRENSLLFKVGMETKLSKVPFRMAVEK